MTIGTSLVALALLVAAAAWLPAANAQSQLETFRPRHAPIQPPAGTGAEPSVEGLQDTDGTKSKFALPAGARVERDLSYGSDPAQKLDVYRLQEPKQAPILVMVHGGAWIVGDKGNSGVVANKVQHWLPRGYIVVSVNYRMSRPPSPLNQAEDVGRALAHIQARAADWGGDASRVVLIGHSAGAHLVALFTVAPDIAGRTGAGPWLGSILLDSAAHDVVELMKGQHPRFYDLAFGADPSRWAEVSPIHQLVARPVPMILVCSSRRNDSCPAARRFAAKAVSLGGRATVLSLDLNHGEINRELGRSPGYTASIDDFLRSLGLP
jgi:arylformamidase